MKILGGSEYLQNEKNAHTISSDVSRNDDESNNLRGSGGHGSSGGSNDSVGL